ncbi:GAP family protein [Planomonospora sp. ID67723]|uniref:GAP family protein n=1 Tax=Planomonospora sp. ID67723 TaxID=2738134 RepID=UPI0018C402C1|nr:GAP family protein [Planomonospora sp. ID67723]MBG0831938.1 GAP family protein [Planomonospora sp. ID67723]
MSVGLLVGLAALALVDSTSFGTLGVPLVLLLTGGRGVTGRLLLYLAAIACFYFLVGVGLMLGLDALLTTFHDVLYSRTAYWIQLAVGVGLFALSWRFDSRKRGYKPLWEPRLGGHGAVLLLALTAGVVEVATMVPYLAAIGLLTKAGLAAVSWLPVLAAYVVVMVLPALALMGARAVAGGRLEARLEKLRAWLLRNSASAVGWAMGIAGVILTLDAWSHLQR